MLKHKLPKNRGAVFNLPGISPTTSTCWGLHSPLYVTGKNKCKGLPRGEKPFSVLMTIKLGRKKGIKRELDPGTIPPKIYGMW